MPCHFGVLPLLLPKDFEYLSRYISLSLVGCRFAKQKVSHCLDVLIFFTVELLARFVMPEYIFFKQFVSS